MRKSHIRLLLTHIALVLISFSSMSQDSTYFDVGFSKRFIYFYISNNGDDYVPFFEKQLEYKKLRKSHILCEVENSRFKLDGDTLILDLTSSLEKTDSLNHRIKRFLNFDMWVPTHLYPHQYLFYKLRIKGRGVRKKAFVKLILEINDKPVTKIIERNDRKGIRPKGGTLFW